ncbi:MAG: ATP-binding protein [Rubrivivax sp.]
MTAMAKPPEASPAALAAVVACIESARACRDADIDRARHDARRGLEALRRLQTPQDRHPELEAELLVLLGGVDRQDGLIESAVIQYHAALKLIGGDAPSRIACSAWIGLGWAYAQIGESSRALRYSLQGLKTARALGERESLAHALDVVGTVYAVFGDPVEALRHLEEAMAIARDEGNRRRLCSVLNNTAMTLLQRNELAPALAAARESLRIAEEDAMSVVGLNVVDTVASVLTAMGEFSEAESFLVPAVAEARKRPPNKALSNLLGSLGAIRAASGDPAQAESLHAAALEIATQVGDPALARQCHKRRADLFAANGRWREAYDDFRQYHALNESIAGAKAAKRLTIVRIADEVDALHGAIDPAGPLTDGSSAVGALEALTARLHAQNRELIEARQAAEVASETRSRFLSNMSHELRTPLNGVLGMARLLLRTPLDATQRRYCEAILSSGQALDGLVTDILDHTRIEAGRLVIEAVAFEPVRVVDEVLDAVRPAASAQGLRIAGTVDEALPRTLIGDRQRIRQVLQHLVGNAVKFTRQGSVDIGVGALAPRDGDARCWVRFAVHDTGIGVEPDVAATLFQPFVQADDSPARPYGGSGLGLAISRQLVERMGGTIDLRSEPGRGSTFWFDLPLRPLP